MMRGTAGLRRVGVDMIVFEMKCQMCGQRFEVELLDRDDPEERNTRGFPARCPKCSSPEIEKVRPLRRIQRRGRTA
jgi:DNA-directed RNA polymerase subunit RPC12/RpoP